MAQCTQAQPCGCCDTDPDTLFGGGDVKVVSSGWDVGCLCDYNHTYTLTKTAPGTWVYEDCAADCGIRWTLTATIVGTAITIALVLDTVNGLCFTIHTANWGAGYTCKLPTPSFTVSLSGGDPLCPAGNPATLTVMAA